MRISDWSSDVCSSDLLVAGKGKGPVGNGEQAILRGVILREIRLQPLDEIFHLAVADREEQRIAVGEIAIDDAGCIARMARDPAQRQRLGRPRQQQLATRSEEHTSELQSLMRTSYAVFCLHKKN